MSIADKINALMNKADVTDNEAEAEAFYAKAMALIAKHQIDEAQLAEARGVDDVPIKGESFVYSTNDANLPFKRKLLWSLDSVLGTRTVIYNTGRKKNFSCSTVGFADDIAMHQQLYFSLLLQAQRFAKPAYKAYRDAGGWQGKKAFMTDFGMGFTSGVTNRMLSTRSDVVNDTAGAGLVLATRESQIDNTFDELFPSARPQRRSGRSSDFRATAAGSKASSKADIGLRPVKKSAKELA